MDKGLSWACGIIIFIVAVRTGYAITELYPWPNMATKFFPLLPMLIFGLVSAGIIERIAIADTNVEQRTIIWFSIALALNFSIYFIWKSEIHTDQARAYRSDHVGEQGGAIKDEDFVVTTTTTDFVFCDQKHRQHVKRFGPGLLLSVSILGEARTQEHVPVGSALMLDMGTGQLGLVSLRDVKHAPADRYFKMPTQQPMVWCN